MAAHKDLTGADLHEPKGAATAAANRVYIADGIGSGDWSLLTNASLDSATFLNLNYYSLLVKVSDLANASVVVVPITQDSTLLNATSTITAAISGGDSVLTLTRAGAATIGTITIDDAGSGEGITDVITTPANNVFTAPSYLKIASDGGPTGGTSDAYILLEFSLDV